MAISDRIPTPKRLIEIRRSLPMDAGNVEFGVAVAREALKAERARSRLELQRAVRDERERCAVVCESGAPWAAPIEWWQKATKRDVSTRTALECAAAIRRPEPSNGWPDIDGERSAKG